MANKEQDEPEIRVTEIVGGPEVEGITSTRHIKAGDLDETYLGKFLGCNDAQRGVNYQAKIVKVRRFEGGKAPGVSIWVRYPQVLDRLPFTEQAHLPFDADLEIVELIAA